MLASLETVEDINQALKEAIEYRRNGDFDNAILVYQKLIQLQPKNPIFYDRKAQAQAQQGNFSEAIKNYQQAINLGIDNPIWTYKNLGDALREENKLEEAELIYLQATKVNSGNPFVYDCLGQVQAQQEKFSEAIENYRQAIRLGIENSTWTYKNLENALKAENRIEEAESVYKESLKTQSKTPTSSDANGLQAGNSLDVSTDAENKWLKLHHQGDDYFQQQQWKKAIACYEQVRELNPDYFWSHYNLGRALSAQGQWHEALAVFQQAITLNSDSADAQRLLGKACYKSKKWHEAISAFRKALKLEPNQPNWVKEKLAEALAEANHPLPSEFATEQTEVKSEQDLLKLAQEAEASKELAKAIALYERAVSSNPDTINTYHQLGKLLVKQKRYDEAISIYQKAIKVQPQAKTYELLATPLEKLLRWSEIVDAYSCAIDLRGDYYLYHHRLGNFYHKLGNAEEAITSYRRAIDLNPNYAWVHYHLGETYKVEGSFKEAINCYQTALKVQPDLDRASQALADVTAKQEQIESKLSTRKKIQITAIDQPTVQSNLKTETGIAIVMYPRFKSKQDFSDHFYRMLWYLNPLIEQIGKITIPIAFQDVNPDACPSYLDEKAVDFYDRFADKISFNFIDEVDDFAKDIKSATFLLRWNMEEEKDSTSKDPGLDLIRTKKVWRIDHRKEQFAGSFYLKCGVENDREYERNLAESQEKLHDLAESLKSETGFIFGTGPSLSQAYNFRFDNGETIACNSMLKNKTLMEYLSPRLIVAADPIFHAGCSSYAGDFRKYLSDALEYFQSHLIVPMRDIHIYKHNLPKELRDRVIGVPLKKAEVPNLNLLEEFHVTSTGNVLTLYLLPLAATLFDRIGIMGCDGRPLQENNYFWKHDPQFANC